MSSTSRPTPPPGSRRVLRVGCGLSAMALIVGIAVAAFEIGARRSGHFRVVDDWWLLDPELGYRMSEPSTPMPPPVPPEHVVLGDSIAYPDPERESFSELLAGHGVNVVDLAASGYGLDQEYLLLRRHARDLAGARTLTLSFCVYNDFIDDVSPANPHDGYRPKPYFELVGGELVLRDEHLDHGPLAPLALFLRRHSATLAAIRGGLHRGSVLEPPEPDHGRRIRDLPRERYLAWQAEGFEVTHALLDEIVRFAREELGVERVLVLVHPSRYAAWDASGYALRPEVRALLSEIDADVFDMGCRYREREIPYDTVIMDPIGHLLTLGHREVATVLWDWYRGDRERMGAGCFLAVSEPASR